MMGGCVGVVKIGQRPLQDVEWQHGSCAGSSEDGQGGIE
jgi:hypothetical protein